MKSNFAVVNRFFDLDLDCYPDFYNLVESNGVNNMPMVVSLYDEIIEEQGYPGLSSIQNVNRNYSKYYYSKYTRYNLALFVIHLAFSQKYPGFRVEMERKFRYFPVYATFRATLDVHSHLVHADAYYDSAKKLIKLRDRR